MRSAGPTVGWRVISSEGADLGVNPVLELSAGDLVSFTVSTSAVHLFALHVTPNSASSSSRFSSPDLRGPVPANLNATVSLLLSAASPTPLFYTCELHPAAMSGRINIIGGISTNITAAFVPSPSLVAHAVLMTVAFAVLIPLGK